MLFGVVIIFVATNSLIIMIFVFEFGACCP